MVAVCPTVTAYDEAVYAAQLKAIAPFADRVHIDLMDGDFAPTLSPGLDAVWWPKHLMADIHLMYRHPMDFLKQLVHLQPHMVVVHAEAAVHHMHFAAELHKHDIKAGLCILQDTPVENVKKIMHSFDHILLFSGHLGYHGGQANLDLLTKVKQIKDHYPDIEIGWDGGINADNAPILADAGITVLNVGGFIQKADHPDTAYATLVAELKT